jgi:hypothetical protein
MLDSDGKFNLDKAYKSCKHCYGTGVAGKMTLTGARLTCRCVVKATVEDEEILSRNKE